MDPTPFPPVRQRFRGVNTKVVQLGNMALMTEFRMSKPLLRKFVCAVSHIFTPENTKLKHLLWGQVRPEIRMEVFPNRFRQKINIISLHHITDAYAYFFHTKLP